MLARILAARRLGAAGLSPVTPAARRAMVVRVVFRAREAGALGRFAAAAEGPGLVARLAMTFDELRLAGLSPPEVAEEDKTLASLFGAYQEALAEARLADQAGILRRAGAAVASGKAGPPVGLPAVFLDVALPNEAARAFGLSLARAAPDALWTIPAGDRATEKALRDAGADPVPPPGRGPDPAPPRAGDPLRSAQDNLFAVRRPRAGDGDSLVVVGAPGPGAEAIECARFLAGEATGGVRFDRMGVLLNSPALHVGPMQEAFARAELPAFYEAGARAPHPAGRAFLLLLDCALEDVSASRFAEYLSLGETPSPEAPRASEGYVAPRRWEELIFDSEVIGGADRWERRLTLFAAELRAREKAAPDRTARERARRRREDLERLTRTALPLVARLARLPDAASWKSWAEALSDLARAALLHPEGVLGCLEETAPMGEVRRVTLEEVRASLSRRLAEVVRRSSGSRYGRIWVGPIEGARGLSFDVVAAPGLAEHVFPRVIREDPMLLDRRRKRLSSRLAVRGDRGREERLRLRLVVGAARRRLLLTYSNLNLAEGRSLAPSYYLAEAFRAGFGETPTLAAIKARASGRHSPVRPGTRAPKRPEAALDRREFALSRIADARDDALGRPEATGAAAWLLDDRRLARGLRFAFMRGSRSWTAADGFLTAAGSRPPPVLEAFRPDRRAWSATGLQSYAECPYRFFLKNLVRLRPVERPGALEMLDPLTRGSLLHEVFFHLGQRLRERGLMPLPKRSREAAFEEVRAVFNRVEHEYRERCAPPYRGIWDDQMDGILADLRGFVERLAGSGVTMQHNEFSFGLALRQPADPESTRDPALLPGPLKLHGSIDAVETRPDGGAQVTDYKTGKASLASVSGKEATFGGRGLQPLLYAHAWGAISGEEVAVGRLYYATVRGAYRETEVRTAGAEARSHLVRFVHILKEAILEARFPALPHPELSYPPCNYCDYLSVCGPAPARHKVEKRRSGAAIDAVQRIRRLP